VRPQLVRAQATADYLVPIRNRGNAPLRVFLSGEDDEAMARFTFDPPQLTIPPGGEARATLTVDAARLRDAPEQRRSLNVLVEGGQQRTESHATFLQTPTITRKVPWWLILSLFGAAFLFIGAFAHWAHGDAALCLHGKADNCLSYTTYVNQAFSKDLTPPDVGGVGGVFHFATSLGIFALLLSLAVLIGLRGRSLTLVAGILGVILAIVLLVTLKGHSSGGLVLVLLGGILAAAGGAMAPRR
jgi:hypothetical protein